MRLHRLRHTEESARSCDRHRSLHMPTPSIAANGVLEYCQYCLLLLCTGAARCHRFCVCASQRRLLHGAVCCANVRVRCCGTVRRVSDACTHQLRRSPKCDHETEQVHHIHSGCVPLAAARWMVLPAAAAAARCAADLPLLCAVVDPPDPLSRPANSQGAVSCCCRGRQLSESPTFRPKAAEMAEIIEENWAFHRAAPGPQPKHRRPIRPSKHVRTHTPTMRIDLLASVDANHGDGSVCSMARWGVIPTAPAATRPATRRWPEGHERSPTALF